MARQRILSATFCFLFLGLGACTKEAPKTLVNKSEATSKGLLSTEAEYLYSAAMQNASRSSPDVLPFSSGDNKRVKLEWTKTSLRVLEMEKDARFQDNQTNNKLVLEIPVEHVDYKCDADKYGECTNKEIEDKDKNWDQKRSFQIKMTEAKSGGLDLLPILISQTVGEDCFEEISSKVLTSEITEDSVNLRIERNFKTKLKCFGNDMGLDDAAVSAVFHYSLVKANSVISKGYQPIAYPKADEKTFGFFSTEKIALGIDNNRTEVGRTLIMNRWNPERSEIVYYLSDEFNKPANAQVKALTRQTVDNLNQGLAQAGVKFRINLKDPAGKNPGDIRNSMIVLVEDPVASSVIGYGPQTEDPVTGEIVSARTVMFLGTIKKYIQRTYGEILREKKQDQLKTLADTKAPTPPSPEAEENGGLIIEEGRQSHSKISPFVEQMVAKIKMPYANKVQGANQNVTQQRSVELEKMDTTHVNSEYVSMDPQARLKYMLESKNCAFSPPTDMVGTGISNALKSKFDGDSKPWEDLSEEKKQAVIDIILPEIWVPTLIHELGHNLGLRHNFKASEDKKNYYTGAELAQLKVDHEIPYSSVMDYGNNLKSLAYLGKYDIAALKFGYLRILESEDGKEIPVVNTLKQTQITNKKLKTKSYGYCTDEHVGLNAGCKRFDQGTNFVEITRNLIRDYKASYPYRNFRNGKENMSVLDDVSYAQRIKSTFMEIRSIFESYERLKYEFYPADSKIWITDPYMKDLKLAAIMGGEFFVEVLLTPDVICAYVEDADPKDIKTMFLNPSAGLSCSDVTYNKGYKGVGQIGKSIISRKSPRSENSYIDQIDVRGIWIDKMLAAQALFKRQTGNVLFDEYADNYMDMPELQKTISDAVFSFQSNEVTGPVEVTLNNGESMYVNISHDVLRTHMVPKPIYSVVARRLGVPDRAMQLQEKIGQIIAKEMVNGAGHESSGAPLSDAMKVTKVRPTDKQNFVEDVMTFRLGSDIFVASEDNVLAIHAMKGIRINNVLVGIPKEKLDEIIKAREAGVTEPPVIIDPSAGPLNPPEMGANGPVRPAGTLSPEEVKAKAKIDALVRAAWKMRLQDLQAFAAGLIQSSEQFETILRYLPNEN